MCVYVCPFSIPSAPIRVLGASHDRQGSLTLPRTYQFNKVGKGENPLHLGTLLSLPPRHHYAWSFMWVLGGKTQVLVPVWQALYQVIQLPATKNAKLDFLEIL